MLPFANLSADPKEEYFADGLSEQVVTELSRFRELVVIARNTTFQYEGQAVDSRKAVALNPNPPGWHYLTFLNEHYRKGEYEEALAWAKKLDLPGHFGNR